MRNLIADDGRRLVGRRSLNGRYSMTVMSFGAVLLPFAPVQKPEVRTLFERLGISHDCRALHSRNSCRIQIPICRRSYTFARFVEQRRKKGDRRSSNVVRVILLDTVAFYSVLQGLD